MKTDICSASLHHLRDIKSDLKYYKFLVLIVDSCLLSTMIRLHPILAVSVNKFAALIPLSTWDMYALKQLLYFAGVELLSCEDNTFKLSPRVKKFGQVFCVKETNISRKREVVFSHDYSSF